MLTRRAFMLRLAAAAAALCGGRALAAPAPPPSGRSPASAADAWINIGPADSYPIGAATPVAHARLVAGNLNMSKPELIVFRSREGIRVVSSRCPHRGCTVTVEKGGGFTCPCHQSRFDAEGRPIRGPAKESLPWYDLKFTETGDVLVNKTAAVQHGKPYPVPLPGALPSPAIPAPGTPSDAPTVPAP
jgi:Rieske Fe-S protein